MCVFDIWEYDWIVGNDIKSSVKSFNKPSYKNMVKGNFLGAAIVAIMYTIYILINPLPAKWQMVLALVVLNALTIVLMSFAFKK